ncbi:FMN-linked oxidoreductase [Trametes elegans]|nr:FMN-linked oxidoreductase [Trametes elegans]
MYAKWGAGRWGIVMTGNVQVDKQHLSLGRDMVIPEEITPDTLAPWRRLASAIHTGSINPPSATSPPPKFAEALGRPLALIQLSHAGRQSFNVYGGRAPFAPPLAPSAVRLGEVSAAAEGWLSQAVHRLMIQTPREMTLDDIRTVVAEFVRGAQVAAQSGFDGVQVHAAHGYLISQFISPKSPQSNRRTDEYSADTDPLHLLRDVVQAIRAPGVVPDDFVVGVKLNSADYARDNASLLENRALDHVREIGAWGLVDFIEVSGGDYEDPQFADSTDKPKSSRQVIFESFAERSMEILAASPPSPTARPPPLVCLTGGLTTLPKMASVLAHEHADLLGIGRLAVTRPLLPAELHAALAKLAPDAVEALLIEPPRLDARGVGSRPRSYASWRGLEHALCWVLALVWRFVPARIPRLVGASGSVAWYNIMMRRIAAGQDVDYTIGTIGAVLRFYLAPYPPSDPDAAHGVGRWTVAALLGVVIGIGLGQVL